MHWIDEIDPRYYCSTPNIMKTEVQVQVQQNYKHAQNEIISYFRKQWIIQHKKRCITSFYIQHEHGIMLSTQEYNLLSTTNMILNSQEYIVLRKESHINVCNF